MSWREFAGVTHLLVGTLLAGGTMAVAWLGWSVRRRRGAGRFDDHWGETAALWCKVGLALVVVAIASGLVVLDSALVAVSLLTSTPYGRLLAAKVILTVLLAAALGVGSRVAATGARDSNAMRLFGGLAAAVIIVISFMMRYV